MKKFYLLIFSATCLTPIFGQDEEMKTLFGDHPFKIGGFAGPFMSFTMANDEFAHMMGGGGCVLLNDFFIGGYGIGITNNIPYASNADTKINFGHGGFWMGYNFMSNRLIHPVFDLKTGWGSIKEKTEYDGDLDEGDRIFVLTPTIGVELNVTRFFRIGVGANYQAVFLVDDPNFSENDFSTPGAFLSFKFGAF